MEAPKFPSIFKNVRSRPRGFNYIPRYYDPEKEDFEQRMKAIEHEMSEADKDVEAVKDRVRQSFRRRTDTRPFRSSDRSRSLRLIIILGILLVMMNFLFRFLEF